MNSIRLLFCICFLITVNGTYANELPIIQLHEGTNKIALTIDNQWNNDLSNVTVKIDNDKLPEWLVFQSVTQTINVPSGTKGQEKLYLKLMVTDAPPGAEAEIPYMLVDDRGNKWNYNVRMHVNSGKPLEYALYTNHPNPFNPITTISYSIKNAHHTKLIIFNVLGQKIRTLVDEPQTAGIHTVQWNGRNESGKNVSSGVYFYRLEAGSFIQTKRMLLLE